MKSDLISLAAAAVARGAEREARHDDPAGLAHSVLVAAALVMIACGVVLTVLWFVWKLAETIP